ncbi:MAG: hypothetical protein WCY26_05145 [Thiohalobacteraceae bacterium]
MSARVLVGLVFASLAALFMGLAGQSAPAAVWRHVLFAMGVMPLILGAMLYFIPVLTRSTTARGAVLLLPPMALVLGVGAVLALHHRPSLLPGIAAAALLVVALEIAWAWRRRVRSFGTPHPGLDWYLFALAALVVALALIVTRAVWPGQWALTRVLHLHLNLFGFLGLTAVGTLRVLLPTALGEQDAHALPFLRTQLPFAVAGAVLIAVGAAFWPPAAFAGAAAWAWPALVMLRAMARYRRPWWSSRGAGIVLVAAAGGWVLAVGAGLAHGYGLMSADAALALLVYLFLLPLVTGATSHLLPIWRWPGRVTPAHAVMRAWLTAGGGLRVTAFWASAALTFAGVGFAPLPAAFALAVYLLQVSTAFVRVRSAA